MLNEVSNEVREMVSNYKFNRKVFKGSNMIKVDAFTATTVTIMGVEIEMPAGAWKLHGVSDARNMHTDAYLEQFYLIRTLPNRQMVCDMMAKVNAATNYDKVREVSRRFDYSAAGWLDENGEPMTEAKWAAYRESK